MNTFEITPFPLTFMAAVNRILPVRLQELQDMAIPVIHLAIVGHDVSIGHLEEQFGTGLCETLGWSDEPEVHQPGDVTRVRRNERLAEITVFRPSRDCAYLLLLDDPHAEFEAFARVFDTSSQNRQ